MLTRPSLSAPSPPLEQRRTTVVVCLAVTALLVLTPVPSAAVLLALAGAAQLSWRWSVRALLLGFYVVMFNPAFSEGATLELMARQLLVLSVAASVVGHRLQPQPAVSTRLVLFAAAPLSLNALLVSYLPLVSSLKLASLAVGIFCVYSFAGSRITKDFYIHSFMACAQVFLLSGLPLIWLSQGYARNSRGYQGLLAHPQTFGVFAAIVSAYLVATLLSSGRLAVASWLTLIGAVGGLVLSEARTGMVALMFGLLAAAASLRWRGQGSSRLRPEVYVGALMLLVLLAAWAPARSVAVDLVDKKGAGHLAVVSLWTDTRGDLASSSWNGFKENPAFGVGFGLPVDPASFAISADPWFDLPIGGSVEKGIILTALLEELGIVGTLPLAACLANVWRRVWHRTTPAGIAVVAAALASNLGESTLTSFGGLGWLIWTAIGLGWASIDYDD